MDSGETVARGEIGVIEVKGPNVVRGYWRMPEKTAQEFRSDGFFITGDLGRVDADCYIHLVGRTKDVVISGGYNVYQMEVESEIDAPDLRATNRGRTLGCRRLRIRLPSSLDENDERVAVAVAVGRDRHGETSTMDSTFVIALTGCSHTVAVRAGRTEFAVGTWRPCLHERLGEDS